MDILFDKNHPKSLVEAIRLIQNLDPAGDHTVSFYDTSTKDDELRHPVLLRIDKHKRGLEPATEILYESGFRVFALKFSNQQPDFFDLSLTVLGLWPTILKILKEKQNPFIYKNNKQFGRLIKVRG